MGRGKSHLKSVLTSFRRTTLSKSLLASFTVMCVLCGHAEADPSSTEAKNTGEVNDRQAIKEASLSPHLMEDVIEQRRILESARQALELRLKNIKKSTGEVDSDPTNDKKIDRVAIARLISIYENMSPREAAAVFDVMDPHVLVAISARMNTRKLSVIMAQMSRERVNMVSQYLVGVRHFHQNSSLNFSNLYGKASHKTIPLPNNNPDELNHGDKSQAAPLLPSRQ